MAIFRLFEDAFNEVERVEIIDGVNRRAQESREILERMDDDAVVRRDRQRETRDAVDVRTRRGFLRRGYFHRSASLFLVRHNNLTLIVLL